MHPNEQLLINFFTAIQKNDVDALSACYHEDVHYSDDILEDLYGEDARAMMGWLVGAPELVRVINYKILSVDDTNGRVRWELSYRSEVGSFKLREIESEFRFRDGKIVWHHDHMDWGRWSRRAFGPFGPSFPFWNFAAWGAEWGAQGEKFAREGERIARQVTKAIEDFDFGININVNGREIKISTGKRDRD